MRIFAEAPGRYTTKTQGLDNFIKLACSQARRIPRPEEWTSRIPVPLSTIHLVRFALIHGSTEGGKGRGTVTNAEAILATISTMGIGSTANRGSQSHILWVHLHIREEHTKSHIGYSIRLEHICKRSPRRMSYPDSGLDSLAPLGS